MQFFSVFFWLIKYISVTLPKITDNHMPNYKTNGKIRIKPMTLSGATLQSMKYAFDNKQIA